LKLRIIDPELLSVAHGKTGRIAFCFAPELVRRLEPHLTRADDWFVEEMNILLFLEVGLDLRRCRSFLANAGEQSFHVRRPKRIRGGKGSKEVEEEGEGEEELVKHVGVVEHVA